MARTWQFDAVAFWEDFPLPKLAPSWPEGRLTGHELRAPCGGGEVLLFSFGALVFLDAGAADMQRAMERLHAARPGLTEELRAESFTVREGEEGKVRVGGGALVVDRLTPERAGVVALTVAQSAAMELYERKVDELFATTKSLAERLEDTGRVSLATRKLHRFVGQAVGRRNEILSVLHLLDKPDGTWDDPEMDRIYADLRAEFDLKDRFEALERKLGAIQDTLELVIGMARDSRMLILEVAIVAMFLYEILASILRR